MAVFKFLLLCSSVFILATAVSEKIFPLQLYAKEKMTTYKSKTETLSAVSCARECTRDSQCDSCAYDKESGTCYLHVQTDPVAGTANNSIEIFKAVSSCEESEAPTDHATNNVTWQRTGWEMDGNATCNDDYMYVGDRPTFHCSADGQWDPKAGECRQRIWRNPMTETRLDVPKPPEEEWAVCMNGTPTQHTRFTISFEQTERDMPVYIDFRLQYGNSVNTVVVVSQVNGTWAEEVHHNHMSLFPVAVNQTCQVVVKAVTLFDVQIFVDGAYIGNYTTPISMNKVAKVLAKRDVDVHMLDLWCSQ